MSIKLKFTAPGWSSEAILDDKALPELIQLISNHKTEDAPPLQHLKDAVLLSESKGQDYDPTKQWVKEHSASEILNLIGWKSSPEKIVLLAAFHESRGGEEAWKAGDILARYSEAREPTPGNFSRDVSTAIKDGLIAPITARSYRVSRVAWNKIAEAIAAIAAKE